MRPQNRVVVEHFLYLCPLLGLSICTKDAEKNLKLKKKIVYSMALVFIYSVGRKRCYYKRLLQSSFLINDQILQTSCFLFQLTQQLISMVIHQDHSLFGY